MNSDKHSATSAFIPVSAVIGANAAHVLSQHYGGRSIAVCCSAKNMNRVSSLIGLPATELLCRTYAGTSVYITMNREEKRAARNAIILNKFDRLTAGGLSARKTVDGLAEEHGISARHIWRILKIGG